jgi:hypothetical protein
MAIADRLAPDFVAQVYSGDVSVRTHNAHGADPKARGGGEGEATRMIVNRPFNCGLLSSTLLNSTTGNAVTLAQSELVGIVKTERARLACDCQLGIGSLGWQSSTRS